MARIPAWEQELPDVEEGPVLLRQPLRADSELDMTPMIDCTFLLLIFFLVGSAPDTQTMVELPPARCGTTVDPSTTVIITMALRGDDGSADVYLADGKIGVPLSGDPAAQEAAIAQAMEDGRQHGMSAVLIKGEKTVRYHDVSRVAAAATQIEGTKLYLAVYEAE